MSQPWIKFYPRDWRGDQAVRSVSLAARGLWMDMLCIMHEASPYGHLMIGGQPVSEDALARVVGNDVGEVQALLVELHAATVFRRTRAGVIYSKRMTDDHKRAVAGRKAKLEAIERTKEKADPSRVGSSPPPTQKPEARVKDKGPHSPLSLNEAKSRFLGPKEVRDAFAEKLGDDWCIKYIDPCGWQDLPERALIPANGYAAHKIATEGRAVLIALVLVLAERKASA